MLIKTFSGVNILTESAAHVIFPTKKNYGQSFDLKTDEWESDRAWTARINRLIYNPTTKAVDKVLDIY